MAMNLKFDQFGDIETDELGNLSDVSPLKAEMGRFQMFFDTPRGNYFYSSEFGSNEMDIIGKVDIDTSDLTNFKEDLIDHLAASGVASEFNINVDFLQRDALTVTMEGPEISDTNPPAVWNYYTRTGRLSLVEDVTPSTEYSHQIHVHTWKATGDITYDISHIIRKAKEINNMSDLQVANWKHRLYINGEIFEEPGTLSIHYEFDDINEKLNLYTPVIEGKYIRLEIWPAEKANLEATTNPYLMRKSI